MYGAETMLVYRGRAEKRPHDVHVPKPDWSERRACGSLVSIVQEGIEVCALLARSWIRFVRRDSGWACQ